MRKSVFFIIGGAKKINLRLDSAWGDEVITENAVLFRGFYRVFGVLDIWGNGRYRQCGIC